LFTEHGRDYPDYRRWKRVLSNRFLLHRDDHVVAVGRHVRQALIDNEGLPAERIEVIYNGVSQAPFERSPADRALVRSELGYSDGDLLIIQVARLNRLKDHATAIRSIARLRNSHSNVRLLLVGDGEERAALEALVNELDMRAVVRFLGSRSDVPRLLQAVDLFLLTSVSEGIPLTLVEAMLARVPVVATRVGGVPEVIEHGQCGVLVQPADVQGISLALSQLLDCAATRRSLVPAGWQRATTLFSEKSMLASYRGAYLRMSALAPVSVSASTTIDCPGYATTVHGNTC
jgi:glycosyltransferase involved in cell wall biosynthesis